MGTFVAWTIAITGLLLFLSAICALGSMLSGLMQLLSSATDSNTR